MSKRRQKHYSIRRGGFGYQARRKEGIIDEQREIIDRQREGRVQEEVRKKKEEIISFTDTLNGKYIIIKDRFIYQRSIVFKLQIINPAVNLAKIISDKDRVFKPEIEIKFIIWTDSNKSPYPDKTNSRYARFTFQPDGSFKSKVRSYLDDLQAGFLLEYLYNLAQEELKSEGKILDFYKTRKREDIAGMDFMMIIKGFKVPHEVKSSKKALERHEERYPDIPGSYWYIPRGIDLLTRNLNIDLEGIKEKLMLIIGGYKERIILFL